LKWIYHQNDTGKWTHLDNLPDFETDVLFVEQLKKECGFTETCSVVVYDTNPEKQTDLRNNRKNKDKETEYLKGVICGQRFAVKSLYAYFKYHIVTFR